MFKSNFEIASGFVCRPLTASAYHELGKVEKGSNRAVLGLCWRFSLIGFLFGFLNSGTRRDLNLCVCENYQHLLSHIGTTFSLFALPDIRSWHSHKDIVLSLARRYRAPERSFVQSHSGLHNAQDLKSSPKVARERIENHLAGQVLWAQRRRDDAQKAAEYFARV